MKLRTAALAVTVLALGLASTHASADTPIALRLWSGAGSGGGMTAYSGTQAASYAHATGVGINASLRSDQAILYAMRGLTSWEDGWDDACSIAIVPGYLDPARSSHVDAVSRSFTSGACGGSKQEATLPDGAFVTGLQICTNGKDGSDSRMKGMRVWGARLDASANLSSIADPVSFERPNCKRWENRVSCPTGTIATSVSVMATDSIQTMALTCNKAIERSKTPPPYVIRAGTPTFGNAMNLPLTVENTGESNIAYKGVTVRVRATSSSPVACEQEFPNETISSIAPGKSQPITLWAKCASLQLLPSCGMTTCSPIVEWTYNMQSPIGPVGTPYLPVTGSQAVSYMKTMGLKGH